MGLFLQVVDWLTEPCYLRDGRIYPKYNTPEEKQKDLNERIERIGGAGLAGVAVFSVGTAFTGSPGAGAVAGTFVFAMGLKTEEPTTRAARIALHQQEAEERRGSIIHEGG
jgi:hypothetical protein